jgi:hypothetical protein
LEGAALGLRRIAMAGALWSISRDDVGFGNAEGICLRFFVALIMTDQNTTPEQPIPESAPAYTDRYIAFLDILAFSSLIKESEKNPAAFNAALNALSRTQQNVEFHEMLGRSSVVNISKHVRFAH